MLTTGIWSCGAQLTGFLERLGRTLPFADTPVENAQPHVVEGIVRIDGECPFVGSQCGAVVAGQFIGGRQPQHHLGLPGIERQ